MKISEPRESAVNCLSSCHNCNEANSPAGVAENRISCEDPEARRRSGVGLNTIAMQQQKTTTLANTVCSCSVCINGSMTAYEPANGENGERRETSSTPIETQKPTRIDLETALNEVNYIY